MSLYTRGIKSIIGDLTITCNDVHLIEIKFSKSYEKDQHWILDETSHQLSLYFAGKLKIFDLPIMQAGTEFQKKCWENLLKINYGKTISYKEQAIKVAGPSYARAVANANNKNNLPIIIPCHRVIGSSGKLVGYAGGLELKKRLLNIEGSL